jgi:hypothetical protein
MTAPSESRTVPEGVAALVATTANSESTGKRMRFMARDYSSTPSRPEKRRTRTPPCTSISLRPPPAVSLPGGIDVLHAPAYL